MTVNIRDRHVTCNAGGGLATPVILAVSYPKSKRQCRSHKSQVATEPSTEPTANHLPYYGAYLSHFQNQNTNTNTNTVAHSPIHHDGIETNEQPHSPKRMHCGCYGRGRGECEPVDCCLTMPRISRIPAVPHRARDAGVMYELSSVCQQYCILWRSVLGRPRWRCPQIFYKHVLQNRFGEGNWQKIEHGVMVLSVEGRVCGTRYIHPPIG